jgi:hypothetical protein
MLKIYDLTLKLDSHSQLFQNQMRIIGRVKEKQAVLRIRIRCLFDPWIGDPGSGMGLSGSRILDPGSQTHIFESLVTTFWVKISIIL